MDGHHLAHLGPGHGLWLQSNVWMVVSGCESKILVVAAFGSSSGREKTDEIGSNSVLTFTALVTERVVMALAKTFSRASGLNEF